MINTIAKLLHWAPRTSAAFDSWAGTYESDARNMICGRGYSYAEMASAVLEAVRSKPSMRVLEIGTGPGNLGKEIVAATPAIKLSGVDISECMLALAEQKGIYRTIVRASAERLPFPSGEFDAVYTAFMLHSVLNQERAFTEIYRVLRPGGRAALIDLCPANEEQTFIRGLLHSVRREYGAPARYRPVEDYINLAADRGFEMLEVQQLGEARKYLHYLIALQRPT
jgi:ubiquinone/menaquinone biosynthesis C-methylase UbiE